MELFQKKKDGIYLKDFLYIDRPKLSSLYVQLFENGELIEKVISDSEENNKATSEKSGFNLGWRSIGQWLSRKEKSSSDKLTNQNQLKYDASQLLPLAVISELTKRNLLNYDISTANYGDIVVIKGELKLFDFKMFPDDLLSNLVELGIYEDKEANNIIGDKKEDFISLVINTIKKLPDRIYTHLSNKDYVSFSSMIPNNMTRSYSDILFNEGVILNGNWTIIGVLDTHKDDKDNNKDIYLKSESDSIRKTVNFGYITTTFILKQFVGRYKGEYAITPLVIYRDIGS
ncbi:hypothetical protein RO21_10355 [[Actinobacillus] muris]|uniref:Uncharacterized protein n=1 Tax=Muribacter muris TaxID=67855 RepID=A0A0J5P2D1_9PAST|nr:hypothetical protein [Muribacter muris]KMK50688.1 hypothetical protein RO21_10355 [[Actinobacillus] muris] [Muribacter muris]